MILTDYHVHTTFCDGQNTPEEVVLAAIEKGITELGFSGHSPIHYETDYVMQVEDIDLYKTTIRGLAEKYAGSIRILCGIEQDLYSVISTEGFDYVIGSVHDIKHGDQYTPIDHTAETLHNMVDEIFGGDPLALAEQYFAQTEELPETVRPDIIGHFDLITKYNERDPLFDIAHPRYRAAWKKALDKLLIYGRPFEINTGAITRGYRTSPYPNPEMIEYIIQNGGKLILNSDSHRAEHLCYGFDQFRGLAKGSLLERLPR